LVFLQSYDIAVKFLLQAPANSCFQQLTGVSVARWLNVEMPQVHSSPVDLLGATFDENFVHVELQSSNDSERAIRMAEYALRIYRQFQSFPKQVVLYVGDPIMRMPASLISPNSAEPDFFFQYKLTDIRDLNTVLLLDSPHIEDNLLAILTRFEDKAGIVRRILSRIADLEVPARQAAFEQFLIISGLRRLGAVDQTGSGENAYIE
jgi:hypothetical protein